MYKSISEKCKEILSRSSRRFTTSIILNENECSDIKSYTLTLGSSGDKAPLIGSTVSGALEMILNTELALKNHEIELIQKVMLDDGAYENIPMGYYTVTSAINNGSYITIKAAGCLSTKGEKAYFSSLEYPNTTINVLNEISTLSGIKIHTEELTEIEIASKPEGYTYREMIGYIAAMYGAFATEDRDGYVRLKWYEKCETDIFKDKISEPNLEQDKALLASFKVTSNENTFTKGTGLNGINISNPFMTEAAMDIAWESIKDFVYTPGTIHILSATPCMDIWDMYDLNNNIVIGCSLVYTYDGGLQADITSEGFSETDSTSNAGPLTRQMERYYAELVLINKAMVNTLTVEKADARYIAVDKLDVVIADIEEAVIGDLTVNFADIHLSNIDVADIGKFYAKSGILENVLIEEGSVTGELKGVHISGDLITANTLKVKDLLLEGEDGLIYQINALSSGLTASQLSDEAYQNKLSGTDLLAKSVTADKINVKDLTAFGANIAGFKIKKNSELALENAIVDSGTFTDNGNGSWNLNGTIHFNYINYFGYELEFVYGCSSLKTKTINVTINGKYQDEDLEPYNSMDTIINKTGQEEYSKTIIPYGIIKLKSSNGNYVVPDKISVSISCDDLDVFEFDIEGLTYGSISYGTDTLAGNAKSIYLSAEGISLGKKFVVTPDGYMTAMAGKIGCLNINELGKLTTEISGDPALIDEYISLKYEAGNVGITDSIYATINGTSGITARGLHAYRQHSYSDIYGTYNTNPYDREDVETTVTSDCIRTTRKFYEGIETVGTLTGNINFSTLIEKNTTYSLCDITFDRVEMKYLEADRIETTSGTVENLKVSGSLNATLWKGAGGRGLIDAITVTISGTINASSTGTLSGTFNIPTGYSSCGVIGYNLTTYSLSPVTVKVAGKTVTIAVRNLTTSSVKVSSGSAVVLLVKNTA